MSRPKKKPNYNPHQIMQAFMDAIADAFGSYDDRDDDTAPGLNAVADEFGITSLKARKLLITAGVYSTALSRQIAKLYSNGAKIEQIMKITELSRASVHSYLPYMKIPYNLAELSANAERIRLYRERKRRCEEFCSRAGRITAANRMTAKEQADNGCESNDGKRAGNGAVGTIEIFAGLCVPHSEGTEVYL